MVAESLRRLTGEIPDELCGGHPAPYLATAVDHVVRCGVKMRAGATGKGKRILLVIRGGIVGCGWELRVRGRGDVC